MTAKLSLTRWNPGAGKTFANFSNRVAQTDALLSKIIGTGPPAEWVDVGGYYVSPNEEIGPDKSA